MKQRGAQKCVKIIRIKGVLQQLQVELHNVLFLVPVVGQLISL